MNNKSKKLLTNLGILTISNFSSKILIFLLVPLYTNFLTTAEYGIYDLVISTISLLAPILSLNIIDAVMRFMMDGNCSQSEVATIGLKYVLYSIVIVSLLLYTLNQLNIWQELKGFWICIFLYYSFYILNQYFIQLVKGLEQVIVMGIAGVLSTGIMIITNILFLIIFRLGLLGFFLANILSQAIPVCYLFLKTKFWKLIDIKRTNFSLTKEMLFFCIPLITTTIGWWINSGSDKYIVTLFCGIAASGILSVSYKIPSILNTFQVIFIQAWQISAVKEFGKNSTAEFYGDTFSTINTLMCMVCSLLIIMVKPLAHFLFSKEFYIAWKFVPFLLISNVINCASGFMGPILSAKKDSKSMSISAICGASVNLLLNVILVHYIGMQGVTYATIIASLVIYGIRKDAAGKDIHIDSHKNVTITWTLLCIEAFLEVYTSFWYIEITLMFTMLLFNVKKLKKLLAFVKSKVRQKTNRCIL